MPFSTKKTRCRETPTVAPADGLLLRRCAAHFPSIPWDPCHPIHPTPTPTPTRQKFALAELLRDLRRGGSYVEEAVRLGAPDALTRAMKSCCGERRGGGEARNRERESDGGRDKGEKGTV